MDVLQKFHPLHGYLQWIFHTLSRWNHPWIVGTLWRFWIMISCICFTLCIHDCPPQTPNKALHLFLQYKLKVIHVPHEYLQWICRPRSWWNHPWIDGTLWRFWIMITHAIVPWYIHYPIECWMFIEAVTFCLRNGSIYISICLCISLHLYLIIDRFVYGFLCLTCNTSIWMSIPLFLCSWFYQ